MQLIGTHLQLWLAVVILTAIIDGTTSLTWGNCSNSGLVQANARCAFLTVPLDYDKPNGKKLRIAVSRIAHTSSQADYQGVLFVKRGGAGSSGLTNLLSTRSAIPESVAATYDWISFDPRGTGETGPTLSCVPDFYPAAPASTTPYNQRLENYWLNRSEEYVKACRRNHGPVLPHINTLNTVRDVEQIRKAINADKLHFYATSYSTYMVQLYATLHPNRVGRVVLDSPADSTRIGLQRTLDLSIGSQRVMNIYYEWLAQYDSVFQLGNRSCEVEAHVNKIVEELAGTTIEGVLGQTEFLNFVQNPSEGFDFWIAVARGLSIYVNDGDPSYMLRFTPRNLDAAIAIILTTTCNDRPWPKQWDTVRTDFWRTYPETPLLTWAFNWFDIPCTFWPYRKTPFVPVDGSEIGPILLTAETNAAGYRQESILNLRRTFPRARLITVVDGLSSSNALWGNTCVDDPIVAYLRDGTIPARRAGNVADVECAKTPLPELKAGSKSSESEAQLQKLAGGRFGDI